MNASRVMIIDTGSANLNSVLQAFKRLDVNVTVSSDLAQLRSADHLIFPGVGAAQDVMQGIDERHLRDFILENRQPLLGICLGMQVLGSSSEEVRLASNAQNVTTLGLIEERVLKLQAHGLRLPHMGWNTVHHDDHPLFAGIRDEAYFYFDHSYAMKCGPYTIGTTVYGEAFASAVCRDNFLGVQFHPEKSGVVGAKLLQNFLNNF